MAGLRGHDIEVAFDPRWKNPPSANPQSMFLWGQELIRELRKGDYLSSSGITAALGDGSAAAPSLFFAADTDTGLFRPASNTLGLAAGGISAIEVAWASTGLSISSDERGFWVNDGTGVNIWRLADRVFVGEAANATGNDFNATQGSIVPTSTEGANWALRDSQLLSIASAGLIAVTGFSRSSDQNSVPTEAIGVAGFVINDKASGDGWALYGDVQHESGADDSYGLELAVKNKGSNVGASAYDAPTSSAVAIHINSGDNSYGGSGANPTAVAMQVSAGLSQGYNTGIVFYAGSLAVNPITGFRTAMSMAQAYRISWGVSAGVTGFSIRSDVSAAVNAQSVVVDSGGVQVKNDQDITLFRVSDVTGASVNGSLVAVASTAATPSLTAEGSATDVNIFFNPKGTGLVISDATFIPNTTNASALGATGNRWSDLFLGDGAVVDFNGDATLTHATNLLAFAGASSGYTFSDGNVVVNHTASLSVGAGNAAGRLQVHGTDGLTAAAVISRFSDGATGPNIHLSKSRGASIGTNTIVQNGDTLGIIQFAGADGAGYIAAATISAVSNGTPGTNDMPGALVFATTPDGAAASVEALRVRSDQQLQVAAASIVANGTVATVLGSLGPAGSNTTVQEWLRVRNAAGTIRYIPCF